MPLPRSRTLRLALSLLALAAALPATSARAVRATPQDLGGDHRYLTAIATDKPIYRVGETLFARGVVLGAFDHRPSTDNPWVQLEIKGPQGESVAQFQRSTIDGTWAVDWRIPEDLAGGEYTLLGSDPGTGQPPAERKFDIRAFRAQRLNTQITFERDGYGPGDTVTASAQISRAEGGIPTGAPVVVTALVDGAEVARETAKVDAKGACSVRFKLPARMARGEGAVAFAVSDGGVVETATKTLPILLQTVDLQLYPEGGDLVAGLPSRVYLEARTPAKKPADLAGVIVDSSGKEITRFRTEHEGRGRFELTPAPGERYTLKILEPSGITTTFPLPASKPVGATLTALDEAIPAGGTVRLSVASTLPLVKVTVSQNERELVSGPVATKGGKPVEVTLDPREAEGVLIATVWDSHGTPLAERLLYRRPAHELTIQIEPDKKEYVPGAPVSLTVKTLRDGKPVPAMVGLTVTDNSVLEMVEKRDRAPRLPVSVFLEPNVRELADAAIYLDASDPKAPHALDLLLGTQGWRRFALMDVASFLSQGASAQRALAARVEPPRRKFEEDALEDAKMDARVQAMAAMAVPPPAAPLKPAPRRMAPLAADKDRAPAANKVVARGRMQADDRAGKKIAAEMRAPVYVREYSHALRPDRKPNDRIDFTETLYWNAALKTDPKTGTAQVRFATSDSVTTFRVLADGYTSDGILGSATGAVTSVQPFYIEPKLPLEVSAGDRVRVPVALINGTSSPQSVTLQVTSPEKGLKLPEPTQLNLAPNERGRAWVELAIPETSKPATLVFAAKAGEYTDTVTRPLVIRPRGFPIQSAVGGMVSGETSASHKFAVPESVLPGSATARALVFPTPMANMTGALERLIQDPYGCFEQTSSTSYPLTMAEQYFETHTGVDPKVIAQAKEKLEAGYKRLVSFETKEKGFEWFGEAPGHEALTAYGLMHFSDMAKVRSVDAAMLERSRAWLMKQRDGEGGFTRKRRALHTWIEDKDASNGYILWALLESGQKRDLDKEIASFKKAAAQSNNSYVTALGANVAALTGDKETARSLMEKLRAKQSAKGAVAGATTSVVGSGGEALEIETSSLATLAWLRDSSFAGAAEKGVKYLAASCEGGRYGSTQSTVLALKAIVAYDQSRAHPKAPGKLLLKVDGKPVGAPIPFDAKTQGTIELPDFVSRLTPGTHTVQLEMVKGSPMPYTIEIGYHAPTPATAPDTKVGLTVAASSTTVAEGELAEIVATVTNTTAEATPMTVAIVGLPGGLEPRHDQLKELVRSGTISAYEVRGREIALYWRSLEANQKVRVPLSLLAAIPGTYTGPASRAYLYYTDENKVWAEGLPLTVTAK